MTNFELIIQHDNSTKFCSVAGHMRRVSSTYKEIIYKGENIIPEILIYLIDNESGMNIIMLLMDISGQYPYEPTKIENTQLAAYNVNDARKAWIEWGKENNYI